VALGLSATLFDCFNRPLCPHFHLICGMEFTITLLIMAFTAVVSFTAFSNDQMRGKMLFYPYGMNGQSDQYYRFVSCGFIHADATHLIFNMLSLYFFGPSVERFFERDLQFGSTIYMVFYISAIAVASAPAFFKHKTNSSYAALGASGAVSAVIFASILFDPIGRGIGFFFLPPILKAYAFGILYLVISAYLDKRGNSNIGHDAHFWGGVYGLVFPLLFKPQLLQDFIQQISSSPSPFINL
jgi:membrane associated rhomboid family serine protease